MSAKYLFMFHVFHSSLCMFCVSLYAFLLMLLCCYCQYLNQSESAIIFKNLDFLEEVLLAPFSSPSRQRESTINNNNTWFNKFDKRPHCRRGADFFTEYNLIWHCDTSSCIIAVCCSSGALMSLLIFCSVQRNSDWQYFFNNPQI